MVPFWKGLGTSVIHALLPTAVQMILKSLGLRLGEQMNSSYLGQEHWLYLVTVIESLRKWISGLGRWLSG